MVDQLEELLLPAEVFFSDLPLSEDEPEDEEDSDEPEEPEDEPESELPESFDAAAACFALFAERVP